MSTTPAVVKEPEKVVPAASTTEVPVSPNAETDKRVSEVLNSKRKKKHPVEARIAELTAKQKATEEQAAKDKADLEKKLADQNEVNVKAEVERRKAEAIANDKRPVREDFPGDANGTAEFTAKMAEWVIRQQDKITAKPAAAPAAKEPEPAEVAARKAEFDGFLEAGKAFITRNPDFNEVLDAAAKRGLTLDNQATAAIITLKAPEVAYFLAKPENDEYARKFQKMSGYQQSLEVARLAERLAAHPADFVSNAPRPGQRVNGNAVTTVRPDEMSVDDYLRQRRADIKAGMRRR